MPRKILQTCIVDYGDNLEYIYVMILIRYLTRKKILTIFGITLIPVLNNISYLPKLTKRMHRFMD